MMDLDDLRTDRRGFDCTVHFVKGILWSVCIEVWRFMKKKFELCYPKYGISLYNAKLWSSGSW